MMDWSNTVIWSKIICDLQGENCKEYTLTAFQVNIALAIIITFIIVLIFIYVARRILKR